MGNTVVCDGYYEGRTTEVFTHIHTDHINKFPSALGNSEQSVHSSIRLGIGRFNNESEIDFATTEIISTVKNIAKIKA